MTAELKPCPFCGGEASEVEDQGHSTAYNVGCFNGDCTIEPNTWADTKAEAIAAWNTRADLSRDLEQARQDIADLRQAVRYANDHADQAKSERDAAIARAEKAEADRDEWRKTAITKIEGKTE
jgi:Lar family restriction alleviation protein